MGIELQDVQLGMYRVWRHLGVCKSCGRTRFCGQLPARWVRAISRYLAFVETRITQKWKTCSCRLKTCVYSADQYDPYEGTLIPRHLYFGLKRGSDPCACTSANISGCSLCQATWQWEDGTQMSYLNWVDEDMYEPVANNDCGVFSSVGWLSVDCVQHWANFVCERKVRYNLFLQLYTTWSLAHLLWLVVELSAVQWCVYRYPDTRLLRLPLQQCQWPRRHLPIPVSTLYRHPLLHWKNITPDL